MSTIKQRLKQMFKIDIKKNRKLLLAAVVLFCLSLPLVAPLSKNKSVTIEQSLDELNPQDNFATDKNYLTINTLASLTNQPNSLDNTNQDSFINGNSTLATLQENAFLNQTSPITFISQEARSGLIAYTVQENDTLSSIAASFGISTYTLLWANNLKETSIIRPGDELTVLPVTGVLHRIKDGETIGWIAKYYDAETEEIIAFNNSPADGAIQVGEKLIIPDGQMPVPARPKTTYVASVSYTGSGTGVSRIFPYGQCTWYVSQKKVVPWSGHAKAWLANSQAYGYKTGSAPQVGAIIVTRESWYGHVGYVEAVKGDWVTFSEMNHLGWGVKSVRTIHINDSVIRGYIY